MYKYFEFITEHKYKGDIHDLKKKNYWVFPLNKKVAQ